MPVSLTKTLNRLNAIENFNIFSLETRVLIRENRVSKCKEDNRFVFRLRWDKWDNCDFCDKSEPLEECRSLCEWSKSGIYLGAWYFDENVSAAKENPKDLTTDSKDRTKVSTSLSSPIYIFQDFRLKLINKSALSGVSHKKLSHLKADYHVTSKMRILQCNSLSNTRNQKNILALPFQEGSPS